MKVLGIIGQKGGTGKTNTALGLGVAASQDGHSVAVIDLDPQITATKWSDRRGEEEPAVVSCQVSRLEQVLEAAEKQGADLAIIDTPGKSTDALIAAAKVADLDDELRSRLPKNFLVDPEIERAFQRGYSVICRTLHDALLENWQDS